MKRLIRISLLAAGLLFGLNGNAFAGYSSGMTICHCPPGHGGTKCFEITINSQGAYNGHFPNHTYDHEGACTAEELSTTSASNSNGTSNDTESNVGSGTVDGFSVPKSSGSNWREQ